MRIAILLTLLSLNLTNCTTTTKISSNDLKDRLFVFDSDLRRITLTFDDSICTVQQQLKIQDNSIEQIDFFYTSNGNQLITSANEDSAQSKFEIDGNIDLPKKYYSMSHEEFSFWNNDDGTIPCLGNLKILKGTEREYLYCQKKVGASYYNFFFMEISELELQQKTIQLEFQ